MKIAFILVRTIVILAVFGTLSTYVVYKIYGTSKFNIFIGPILTLLPFILLIVGNLLKKNKYIELFVGQYLFYFNFFFLSIVTIFCAFLLMKLFKIDVFEILSMKKWVFNISMIVIAVIFSYIGHLNFVKIKTVSKDIKINKVVGRKNLKIGFISDVHLNGVFDKEPLEYSLKKMSDEKVDVVIIGGDFLDNTYKTITGDIKSVVSKYKFPFGINMVLGNHEYYGGINENIEFIKSLGINILRDDVLSIGGNIKIIGRDDEHNKSREKLIDIISKNNLVESEAIIVVDHSPKSIKESIEYGIDFQLSGHTHNGQIFPMNLIVDRMYDNAYGLADFGKTNTYVSSGLGTWMIPYRIGSQSEILIVNLEFNEI